MSLRLSARPGDPVMDRVRTAASRIDPEAWLVIGETDGPTVVGDIRLDGGDPEWRVEAAILRALAPRHIVFLCVANSARSQLGEGIGRSLAPAGVQVSSAGSEPTSVRPQAVEVLREIGIDISDHRSKLTDDLERPVDAVITLCAEENCPLWLEKSWRLHWPLPDPVGVQGSDEEMLDTFRFARDELLIRLSVLFQEGYPVSGGSGGS